MSVSVSTFLLKPNGRMLPCVEEVKMDRHDFEFFNGPNFHSSVYSALQIYRSQKTDMYAMIIGPKLLPGGDVDVEYMSRPNAWFSQKLHLQVARRAGFDFTGFPEFYVIHHLNHDRLDARRGNLCGIPNFVNMLMQITSNRYIGVRPSGKRFCVTVRIGHLRDMAIHKTYDTEREAAVAWVQLMNDYLKLIHREFTVVYRCDRECMEPVHTLHMTYVRDACEEYRSDRSEVFRLAMRGIDDAKRRRIEEREDKQIVMLMNGEVEEVVRHTQSQRFRDEAFSKLFREEGSVCCVQNGSVFFGDQDGDGKEGDEKNDNVDGDGPSL